MEKKMKMRSALKVRKSYEEVADLLKEHILNGTYQPGERLPSFRELSEQMGVGQSTIREAVSSLKTIGLRVDSPWRRNFRHPAGSQKGFV